MFVSFLGARSHGGGCPDRQVLVDAGGQGARGRAFGQAREKHDSAADCTEMSSSKRLYIFAPCTQIKFKENKALI